MFVRSGCPRYARMPWRQAMATRRIAGAIAAVAAAPLAGCLTDGKLKRSWATCVAFVVLFLLLPVAALGDITASGNVSPDPGLNPWQGNTSGYVGQTGAGALTVNAG